MRPILRKRCNICGNDVHAFKPYKGGTENTPQNMILLDCIGSDIDNFSCPLCGCTDRERHLKLYLQRIKFLPENPRILHFAPEAGFVNVLAEFSPEIHVRADLHPTDPRFEKINIEDIPYSQSSFDLVVANHVLEHVSNPARALAEINRVLKPRGFAILQTPFSQILEDTFEDPGISTPELRLQFYGQEDHERLFGKNIFEIFGRELRPRVQIHHELFREGVDATFGVNSKEPLFLFSKKKLEAENKEEAHPIPNNHETDGPLVSILCVTYNHARYIEKALASFLIQETNFKFEVLVGDDVSSDETREIVGAFKSSGNCEIRPIYNERNLGGHQNFKNLTELARGKFLAVCEGDDYWTDPLKLQKQVDFLTANPEVVITYSSVNSHLVGEKTFIDYSYFGGATIDFGPELLQRAPPLNTLTVMYRNTLPPLPPEFLTSGTGDRFIWSLLGNYGKGVYLKNVTPCIYRQHEGGVHSSLPIGGKIILDLKTYYALFHYYRRILNAGLERYFFEQCQVLIRNLLKLEDEKTVNSLRFLPQQMHESTKGKFNLDTMPLVAILKRALGENI
jgi:glycosyltransferase involved in cell wall biosynthesis